MSETDDRLIELLSQMNTNQLRYLSIRGDCSSDKEAAEILDISPSAIYAWPNIVKEAMQLMALDGVLVASEILRRNTPKAAAVKAAGLDSDDERIRQGAASEILDRVVGKSSQHIDITSDAPLIVVNWDSAQNGNADNPD